MDGYNIINAWRDVFDLAGEPFKDGRNRLANMLSNYQGFRNISSLLVFDAHLLKGSQEKEIGCGNIKIIYTKENETADNYIEKFVHRLGNTHTIRVVTSDYLEQTMVLGNGGIRMSPGELREELETAAKSIRPMPGASNIKTNVIESHRKPELLEKLEKLRRDKF